jgi:hypothetical protein
MGENVGVGARWPNAVPAITRIATPDDLITGNSVLAW